MNECNKDTVAMPPIVDRSSALNPLPYSILFSYFLFLVIVRFNILFTGSWISDLFLGVCGGFIRGVEFIKCEMLRVFI